MFEISMKGFRNIALRWVEKRSYGAVIGELFQNAVDENTKIVLMDLNMQARMRTHHIYMIRVEDDNPEGFADIRDAYTLFGESKKAMDPTKRGRFDAGEKYVIALAEESSIETTTGTVSFSRTGGRKMSRKKTQQGSIFTGIFRMTEEEAKEIEDYAKSIILPRGVVAKFNGIQIEPRKPISTFEETLETEFASEEGGHLRKTRRITKVEIHEPRTGETAGLYEMGLRVVDTGDMFHVNVMQRVPLNLERDNVPPAYLRTIRTFVANHMAGSINENNAAETWVKEALGDSRIAKHAVQKILNATYGEKKVIRDPTDTESVNRAVSEGYKIIEPRHLTPEQRANVRKFDLLQTSSDLFPTPKAIFTLGGQPPVPQDKWTKKMNCIYDYAVALARKLIPPAPLQVVFYDTNSPWSGAFNKEVNRLCLKKYVERYSIDQLEELLIHEFAHSFEDNHLSREFSDACCKLGVKLKNIALTEPDFFKPFYDILRK